jgi:hypothetical protein
MNNENRIGFKDLRSSNLAGAKNFDTVMKEVLDLGKTCESQFKTFTKMTVLILADGKLNLFEIGRDQYSKNESTAKGVLNIRV